MLTFVQAGSITYQKSANYQTFIAKPYKQKLSWLASEGGSYIVTPPGTRLSTAIENIAGVVIEEGCPLVVMDTYYCLVPL